MMEQKYMVDIVQLLQDVDWIYDFHVTKIFTRNIFSQMPEEWKASLTNLPLHNLNGIPLGHYQDDWPSSLQSFLAKCQELSLQNIALNMSGDSSDNEITTIPQKFLQGLPKKKTHEVMCLFELMERLTNKIGCDYVLDIGSGLGYIDSLLHCFLKISVTGAESEEKRVKTAIERQNNLSGQCNGIRHIHWALSDNDGTIERTKQELAEMGRMDTHCTCRPQNSRNVNSTLHEQGRVEGNNIAQTTLLGLHACADLSPIMLKMFKSCRQFSSLILLSCCYHKMSPEKWLKEENQDNAEASGAQKMDTDKDRQEDQYLPSPSDEEVGRDLNFTNFPMSRTLRAILKQKKVDISTFGLRLAAQESGQRWRRQTDEDHETHKNSVAFRGILEVFCEKEEWTVKKLRRRCARKGTFSNFDDYLDSVMTNYEFTPASAFANTDGKENQDCQELPLKQTISKEHAKKVMRECHKNVEYLFPLIEPLTGLQLALQPVMEALVLIDRVTFLKEAGFSNVTLEKVFDVEISPRNVALIAFR